MTENQPLEDLTVMEVVREMVKECPEEIWIGSPETQVNTIQELAKLILRIYKNLQVGHARMYQKMSKIDKQLNRLNKQ